MVWRRRRHEVKINDASFAGGFGVWCTVADLYILLIGLETFLTPGLAWDNLTVHCCLSLKLWLLSTSNS